jgi:hypothetical protein
MKTSKTLCFAMLTVVALLLASCATQPAPGGLNPPGFFRGCWHGFTIFFALAGHVFDNSIRIYAFPNSGGWYDFGFFLGAASFLGGGGSSASRRKRL